MTETADDYARRIEALRAFEREYRSRLRSYFWQKIGELNETGDPLDAGQRQQVERARDYLGTWDLNRRHEYGIDPEHVLANQVRALLGVLDDIAPKAGERG